MTLTLAPLASLPAALNRLIHFVTALLWMVTLLRSMTRFRRLRFVHSCHPYQVRLQVNKLVGLSLVLCFTQTFVSNCLQCQQPLQRRP